MTPFNPPDNSRWTRTLPVELPCPSERPPYDRPMITATTPSKASILAKTRWHSFEVLR